MKIQRKTFSYRLKPSKKQRVLLSRYAGSARFVYNYGLSQIKQALDAKQKVPSYTDLANQLPLLKRTEQTAWLKEPHSQILQQSLKDLEQAQKHFFRRLKTKSNPGFPKFKKKGNKDSFRYPQGFKFEQGKLFLPKIGWMRYYDSRPLEGTLKQVTVKREGTFWNIHVAVEIKVDVVKVSIETADAVGIDLGLTHFAYLSNGQVIENPKFLKQDLQKLSVQQRKLSRKKKGSNNRKKCSSKVEKLHIRIKNKRKDFLHKSSTQIAKNHGVVAVENLNVIGMVKNRRLSRDISDAGWRIYLDYLAYKCEWRGNYFVKVDRFFPSTKTCSACSAKQEMPLNARIFECTTCNTSLDRDLNASINIRAAGLSALKACGEMGIGSLDEARITGF